MADTRGIRERLEEIKEWEAKATKGPWAAGLDLPLIANNDPDKRRIWQSSLQVADFRTIWIDKEQSEANAEFAARCRADVPWLVKQLELFSKILDLVATDELFIQPAEGGGWVFWVNVNDMFYPASDGEGIDFSEIPAVWQAWKDKDWPGVVRWVQEKRGGLKLRKSREERILTIEGLREQLEEALRKIERLERSIEVRQ